MDRCQFILEAQEQGWRVFASIPEGICLACSHNACRETVFAPQSVVERGEVPEPCQAAHGREPGGQVVQSYNDLVRLLTLHRARLGVTQLDLEGAIGLTASHVNKLEIGVRTATVPTLMAWIGGLGLRLVLQPVAVPRQTISLISPRRRWRVSMHAIAKAGQLRDAAKAA